MLGDNWADPLMRGPHANTDEGMEFRNEFGDRSEIRKFLDNALCEAVIWVKMDSHGFPLSEDQSDISICERYLNFVLQE